MRFSQHALKIHVDFLGGHASGIRLNINRPRGGEGGGREGGEGCRLNLSSICGVVG